MYVDLDLTHPNRYKGAYALERSLAHVDVSSPNVITGQSSAIISERRLQLPSVDNKSLL